MTRRDVREFLALAAESCFKSEIQEYALDDADKAPLDLKSKGALGAKVLRIGNES